jgi:transitional endoplasmic reticulum ATPase
MFGGSDRGARRYAVTAAILVAVYAVSAPLLWLGRGFDADGRGPLSALEPDATDPPPGATLDLADARDACARLGGDAGDDEPGRPPDDLVAGVVDGAPHYACYWRFEGSGNISGGVVLDAVTGREVTAPEVLKPGGVWRWLAAVKTPGELVFGLVAVVAILAAYARYYRRSRPGPGDHGPLTTATAEGIMAAIPLVGWAAILLPGRSRARRVRLAYLAAFTVLWLVLFVLWIETSDLPDALSVGIVGQVTGAGLAGWLAGTTWLRAPGWGHRDDPSRPDRPVGPPPGADTGPDPRPPRSGDRATSASLAGEADDRGRDDARRRSTRDPAASDGAAFDDAEEDTGPVETRWEIEPPEGLPTFRDVGGMDDVKQRLDDSVGMLLAFSTEAERFRITYNGILLHGPPGTGKTFLAQATAGEHGLRYLRVDVSDIVSKWVGESAQNIRAAFEAAAAELPCLLFFDEFDSVASRRDDEAGGEARRTVNQLLQSLEAWRDVRELVVVAATNHLDRLDPAVIRAGRFDKHVRIDLPDAPARRAVLAAQLRERPVADDLDLDDLAERTAGLTPAALAATVQTAALAAFRETALEGQLRVVTTDHLLGALQARGGRDRPGLEGWSWEQLILAEHTAAELRQLQLMLEDPERARSFGIDPPSGVLLTGPPGTGKTTVARVLAAEAELSFYPVTVTDLTSKWVGESEEKAARLFQRARDNAPSIVFIDEIDAVAARRGSSGYGDRLVNQLLAEMDGISGRGRVFVLAATNRAELLDPALTRGGRLSRSIEIPLPDRTGRERLLTMFTARMPLVDVDLDALAADTEGWSGADLEALCQQAAIEAMVRGHDQDPAVRQQDLDLARAAVAATGVDERPRPPLHPAPSTDPT